MLIGIRIGDNDFYNTLNPFMELFLKRNHRADPVTKEQVVEIFHAMVEGLYLMCQNCHRYGDKASVKNTAEYLKKKVRVDTVFFDQEVLDHIHKCGAWDNGEFHYVDTDQEKVFTV